MDNNSPRSSTRASVISHANSSYSLAGSTRHMLADMNNSSTSDSTTGLLEPPNAPFAGKRTPDSLSLSSGKGSNLSLSVNYVPNKFSSSIVSPVGARFRGAKSSGPSLPKRGGGLDAFKSNEARMPQGRNRLRWNKFKWVLLVTNTLLTLYSLSALVVCLLTWFDVWTHAAVIRTGNRPELILSTLAASLGILTSLLGWAGILLNNRAFLASYTFLSFLAFLLLLVPGYLTYKKRTFNLEGKLNAQWSRALGAAGRMRVQDELRCCGYPSPFVEATVSQTCYARSILPGCKLPYIQFERRVLMVWYTAVFSIVPAHVGVMLAGLLCSNHITYRFGKGMMPEAYRLNVNTMAVVMDNYANQLAEEYGQEVAAEILKQSRAKLESMPAVGYSTGAAHGHAKYDSLNVPDSAL